MTRPDAPLAPLPPEEWDPSLAPILAQMNGAPLNVHRLMARNPALLTAWWSFRNHSVRGGALGPRLAELVILRTGLRLEAWYEWASHVDRGLAAGLTRAEIAAAAAPRGFAEGAPEAALIAAVDALSAERRLPDAVRAALAAHFDAAQVMDLIAIHGMYVILGCMIRTWGLELDPAVAARIEGEASAEDFAAACRALGRGPA